MYELMFLGSGSAGAIYNRNWHSAMLLTKSTLVTSGKASTGEGLDLNKEHLLIDGGGDLRHALFDVGLIHRDIKHVYLSHPHADHIGGMEWLGFWTYFDPGCEKPNLYISNSWSDNLWNNSLCGGMCSHQGKMLNLDSFFKTNKLHPNEKFWWEDVEITPVQTIHYMDGFHFVPSFGLIFEINNIKVFITTDTQYAPNQIMDFYNQADFIFQDCEVTPYASGVHAHYNELITLSPEIKSKMWLYHYQDDPKQVPEDDGFRGFVKRRQVFNFISPETFKYHNIRPPEIETYNHHGDDMTAMKSVRGLHREHSLCQICGEFKPDTSDNCVIAQANYKLCVKHSIVTPVYECKWFETKL